MSQNPGSFPFPNGKMMSDLPYKTLKDISDRLDLLKDGKTSYWRELATLMDYNHITVEKFGMQASKQNGSPGYSLLLDMSNKGVSYEELISYLKRLELFDALVQIGYKEDVKITQQPVATPVMNGHKLRLECKAEGVPRPQYLWFQGQKALENQKSSILEIDKVTPNNAGIYICRVGNSANIVFSKWVEVQVQNPTNKGPVAEPDEDSDSPVVTEHPLPSMLEVGQKLFLNCQAVANSNLEYQWFLNGKELVYGTSQELQVPKAQVSDQGVYVCCIKSNNGASVLTKGAEIIVTPPRGQPPTTSQHQLQPQLPEQAYHMLGQIPDDLPTPYTENPYPGLPPMTGGLGGYGPSPMMGPPFNPDAGFHPFNFPQPSPGGLQSPEGPIGMPEQRNARTPRIPSTHHQNNPMSLTGPRNPSPTTPNPLSPYQKSNIDCELGGEPGGEDFNMDRPCSDKVALLIGNKNYYVKSLVLNTPENDTQDLAGILRSADFKVVSLVNLTKKEMDEAIDYFTQLLGPNVYAVFFFAGHGFELNKMNYMMAVDCTKQKNPSFSVCAQKVLQIMQETKAKLSVVLLDMCRVGAPQDPITDLSAVYKQPYPAKSYPGYHIYMFSCSLAEKAFEVASGGGPGDSDGDSRSVGEGNSIFVAALKDHLQNTDNAIHDSVQNLFSATSKGVYRLRPPGTNGQWQRPEVLSNIAEDLALTDPLSTLLPEYQERRSRRWKDAHSVSEPLVVGSSDGNLALRLHFEAEHTNVLIIQIEVLQGCLMETEIERMNVELVLQEKPISLILAGLAPQLEYTSNSYTIDIQKSIGKNNLLHFKIADLQKIANPELTLHISTNYRWRDSRKERAMWQFQMEHIYHRMAPPLYGKITAHEEHQRMKQQQPPLSHYDDRHMFIPGVGPPPPLHPSLSMQ